MERFSRGLVQGLGMLGITAQFRGKNDVAVGGRKIAGLGIHRDPAGGLLFHASLLLDLDIALMARTLRLPSIQLGQVPGTAELATLRTRTTTVRECLQRPVGMQEVRARVAAGFAGAFAVELEAADLQADELAAIAALAGAKYDRADWVHQEGTVPDGAGAASVRTAGGAVQARVALAGSTIKSVELRGSFFASAEVMADLEARLRWQPGTAAAVGATVDQWAAAHPVGTVSPQACTEVILAAVQQARVRGVAGPYACFMPMDTGTGPQAATSPGVSDA
jgi:lipoate---protein ligase